MTNLIPKSRKLAAILALIALTFMALLPSHAQFKTPPAGNTTQPAPPNTLPAHWRNLAAKLASEDFTQRQSAQHELDKTTWRDRSLLKQLLASTTDEEAKARLTNRFAALEEELFTNPPPISLDVKNASLDEVATALGKAAEVAIITGPPDNFDNNRVRYALTVTDKPFWEVILSLAEQNPFQVQINQEGLNFYQTSGGFKASIFGALAVRPHSIARSSTVDLQDPHPDAAQLNFHYGLFLDPRIRISNFIKPTFTKIVDDAGNILYEQQPLSKENWEGSTFTTFYTAGSVNLKIPAKLGSKITSAKGELRVRISTAKTTIAIPDLEKEDRHKARRLGDKTFHFDVIDIKPNAIKLNMTLSGPDQGEQRVSASVTLIDATGRHFWTTAVSSTEEKTLYGGQFKTPIKAEISLPTKFKDLTIPFELKDLPLPVNADKNLPTP